jgi:hypothetical protein
MQNPTNSSKKMLTLFRSRQLQEPRKTLKSAQKIQAPNLKPWFVGNVLMQHVKQGEGFEFLIKSYTAFVGFCFTDGYEKKTILRYKNYRSLYAWDRSNFTKRTSKIIRSPL